MLQTLLADRFKLKQHVESKEMPVYALVNGTGGLKLQPKPAESDSKAKGMAPMTMETIAASLSRALDRPVLDQTGVTGQYMVSMEVMAKAMLARQVALMNERMAASGRIPGEAASSAAEFDLHGVVQGWGLKLESTKLPVTLVVVEQLEKTPTEN